MRDEDLTATGERRKSPTCGCAQRANGRTCPCKKGICVPLLALLALALAGGLVAKRRNRK